MLLTGGLTVLAEEGPAEQAPDDGTPASPARPALSGAGGSALSGTADGTGTDDGDGVLRRERRKR